MIKFISGMFRNQSKELNVIVLNSSQHNSEIRTMYRVYLKTIPLLFERSIQVQAKLKEIQWIFRQAKDEKCEETVEFYKQIGYDVLKKIEDKEYPPFPQLYSNPLPNQGLHLQYLNRKLIIHQKL